MAYCIMNSVEYDSIQHAKLLPVYVSQSQAYVKLYSVAGLWLITMRNWEIYSSQKFAKWN